MLVKDVIDRIRFNTSTLDDLSGKSITTLFTDKSVVQQLMFALDKYATETQAIEGIYSFPLETTTQSVTIPPLVLRTKAYRFIELFIQGTKYPINIANLNDANSYFRYSFSGVPRWFVPWKDQLSIYPVSVASYLTATLTAPITETDTTIPVNSTSAFLPFNGRLTIGSEVIYYQNLDNTNFYGCLRGQEDSTAAAHALNATVKENNCHIFYYKKHFRIPLQGNSIDSAFLDREMEVVDEHMEIITDYTAYKLLSKIDNDRASFYKVNFEEWIDKVKPQIKRGRSMITNGGTIREQFPWEGEYPMQYLVG